MLVLVTYDVNVQTPEGRRRLRRVAKVCLDHGQRVQNSVFECLIDPAMWVALKAKLEEEIDPQQTVFATTFWAATGSGGSSMSGQSEPMIRKAR